MGKNLWLLVIVLVVYGHAVSAQSKKTKSPAVEETKNEQSLFEKTSFTGLKFRNIGPALTSGRIADIAVHPQNPKIYYVAVASGGVWKTVNSGTTFIPLFDQQGSYSTGCVTIDPNNPEVIWVGTGENNHQRSVGYGDGIYKSLDGGATWKNMGLKNSEHIGKIIVHPQNSQIVYATAMGPLWSAEGDRGLYKTTDGGQTWQAVLTVDEHTGISDLVMDPRQPEVLYATAHQRRRHVFTYIGGGPGSGIWRTQDGGQNWEKINHGLPEVDKGRIGLAISPAKPEVIYAMVEAADGQGGLFKSINQGASWHKQSNYATAGLYYGRIFADPKDHENLFSMDVWFKISRDGGKTWSNAGEDFKHVDNHSIWIDPTDTDHWLVGCDGGIYETWDAAKHWTFKANLAVTQFYKVAVDNAMPFYNVYGGTQDNFSLGGPSRTISANGIANDEWFITNGGDGFETQIDPDNPDIVYAQSQHGVLVRFDKRSGESIGIQPKPRKGESEYIWNWDAPLEISKHRPGRLYFAANKLFRSDDRGNSWTVISDDHSRQINRNALPVMGRVWGIDAVAKNTSTSQYGAIVAFSESPRNADLLVTGTDDGLIHLTKDGGLSWRKIDSIPGVPPRSYVNEVLTSFHDDQIVYCAFNHHKYGDYKPYLFRSNDQGRTWMSLSKGLPDRGSVYAIAEDHVDPNLLFIGTEFGAFFSNDGGQSWKKFAGIPTIAVRDIDIQKRENDLVLGTFGRGFLILDDYSPLRSLKEKDLAAAAQLYPVRDAWSFEYATPYGLPGKAFQGDDFFQGDNLGSAAIFTYYIKDGLETHKEQRQKKEKEASKANKDVYYPAYEDLVKELKEDKPELWFIIRDNAGQVVRKLSASYSTGAQRLMWDLRYHAKDPVSLNSPAFYNPFAGRQEGTLVPPGDYQVTMYRWDGSTLTELASPRTFKVKALNNTVLPAENRIVLAGFQKEIAALQGKVSGMQNLLVAVRNELTHMRKAVSLMDATGTEFFTRIKSIEHDLHEIELKLNGDPIANRLDIYLPPAVSSRLGDIVYESKYSTSGPTKTHLNSYQIVREEIPPLIKQIQDLVKINLEKLRSDLQKAGAPYTPNVIPELLEN